MAQAKIFLNSTIAQNKIALIVSIIKLMSPMHRVNPLRSERSKFLGGVHTAPVKERDGVFCFGEEQPALGQHAQEGQDDRASRQCRSRHSTGREGRERQQERQSKAEHDGDGTQPVRVLARDAEAPFLQQVIF